MLGSLILVDTASHKTAGAVLVNGPSATKNALSPPCGLRGPLNPRGESLKIAGFYRPTHTPSAMTNVVSENCIKCKYTDCVDV